MEEQEPGQWKRMVIDASAGAIAGGISRTVTSPLDVIKIRFQVSNFYILFLVLIIYTIGYCGEKKRVKICLALFFLSK